VKIATWNVNSLRVRLPHVLDWLSAHPVDVLALQETKLINEQFPVAAFQEVGYQVVYQGQPTYNGMAIISKLDMQDVVRCISGLSDGPTERRALAVTINGVRLINFYVPNGESLLSEKYQYKLAWLARARVYLADELARHPRVVVVGDFNIAPEDRDVHSVVAWAGHVLVSEPEREHLRALISLGLHDAFRLFESDAGHFSWWDYRAGAFHKNNGLRIDHVLISEALVPQCRSCTIDKKPRGWTRPSDHVPVIVDLNL
jgi:exodeoxyribonuclease-3